MTFRKILRGLLALLFVASLVVIGVFFRKVGPTVSHPDDPITGLAKEIGVNIRDKARVRDFSYEKSGTDAFKLRAKEAIAFDTNEDEFFRLKDVVFESLQQGVGADGKPRSIAIAAPRAEFRRGSGKLQVFGGFRIEGEATSLMGDSFHYEPTRKVFVSDGPVIALRGTMVGRADSGQIETRQGMLSLEGHVRLRGREAGRPLDLSSRTLTIARSGTLVAEGSVVLKTRETTLRANRVERSATEAGDTLTASGDARFVHTLTSAADATGFPVLGEGDTLRLQRDRLGRPLSVGLERTASAARIDIGDTGRNGARRALANRFEASFTEGRLAELVVPGAVDAAELIRLPPATTGPPRPSPLSLRTLTSGFMRLTFAPDGESLDVGTFEQGVAIADGPRASLKALSGTLRGSDDSGVFQGSAAAPADYRDEKGKLSATTISYFRREERVEATGNVRSTLSASDRSSFPGGVAGEPYFSESDTWKLLSKEKKLLLTGNVRAWQKENVLRCQSLALDDAVRTLTAKGSVRVLMRRVVTGPPSTGTTATTKAQPTPTLKVETVNASGESLVHRELDHLVRIEGKSEVVSGSWLLTADITDIRISDRDRTISYAEARGTVVLEDRLVHRRGEGSKATWRPGSDIVTLSGEPAIAVDEKGNRSTGAIFTFRPGQSRVDCEPSSTVPCESVLRTRSK